MKLTKELLANAFALASGILWVVCSTFVFIFPKFSLTVTSWWMHGLRVGNLGNFNLNLANFLLGGTTLVVSMWVTGYVFGWSLEYLRKKK